MGRGASMPTDRFALPVRRGASGLEGKSWERRRYALSYQTLVASRRYGDGPAGTGFQPFGNQRTVYDGRIQTVNAQFHYRLGAAHLVTGGYEFEHENYAFDFADQSDRGAASAVNGTERSNALFVQDQARFFDGRVLISV